MRLCFLVCVDPETEKTQMFGVRYMPVWAYTLAAYLRERGEFELELFDTRLASIEQIKSADVYFYSALNQDVPANLALLAYLKARYPHARHALGGPATSSLKMAGRMSDVEAFDALFLGDGEATVADFLKQLMHRSRAEQLVYQSPQRFDLKQSRPMDFELLAKTHHHYYGGVIEVSRGCPFLCEFCDIRTLPDNNKAHNRPVTILIEELRQMARLGVTHVLFACDNFIGDPLWASEFCQAIIQLRKEIGYQLRCYTWLTINIANHPALMQQMKLAGFDMFFIGLESFGVTQLLETAKVQNTKFELAQAVRTIQGHGIVVVAGLIFGFDSDQDDATDVALQGILDSGLISGDPTLLTALSGTPLYRRMQLAGRLRNGKVALGGKKYSTNIRYLRPRDKIIADYIRFVQTFNHCDFQLRRYQGFLACLKPQPKQVASGGYIQPTKILQLVRANPAARRAAIVRLTKFLSSPARVMTILRAGWLTFRHPAGTWPHYFFWLFNWSNSIVKYGNISAQDFDIESVAGPITSEHLLPQGYAEDYFEPIPHAKIKAQRQLTIRTLEKISLE